MEIIVIVMFIAFLTGLWCCLKKCKPHWALKIGAYIKEKLFWNPFYRVILVSYLQASQFSVKVAKSISTLPEHVEKVPGFLDIAL